MIGHGDFLDRLAMRQVTPSVGVRPRLPSRFADVGPSGLVEVDVGQPGPGPSARVASTVRGPEPWPVAPADADGDPAPPNPSVVPPVRVVERGVYAQALQPARGNFSAARPAPAAPEALRNPGAELVAPPAEPPLTARAVAAAAPSDVEPSLPERLVPIADHAAPAIGARSDRLVEVRHEVLAVPVVPQRATPTAGRRDQGPPEVTVSIGRIEVRAITDSAPAAPSPLPVAERRPTLSLDEYLERRHGAAARP